MEAYSRLSRWLPALRMAVLVTSLMFVSEGIVRGAGLATNEVLVEVTLDVYSITGKQTTGGNGEILTLEKNSTFSAAGVFAGKLTIPSAGKRALVLTRRLPNGLLGSFNEQIDRERLHIVGEGGVNKDFRQKFSETWWRSGVDLKAIEWAIILDLDQSTWTCSRLSSSAQSALNQTLQHFNYTAIENGPDLDGVERVWASGDSTKPPPDMQGGPPRQGVEASDFLVGEFPKVETPHALDIGDGVYSGRSAGSVGTPETYKAAFNFFWAIRTKPKELELRVTSPALERWRPQAAPSATPGDVRPDPGPALDLTAEVVDPAGTTPLVRIRKLRWWLEGTSRLPGFAMNLPYASSETSPDMEIDHPSATDEGQEVVLNNLTTLRSKVRIKPYDWGGWSTLHVEAELDDGRKLTGKLKGPSGDETNIRLPARDPDSKVATVWKRQIHAQGLADNTDDDPFPEGRRNGDGFTLFEEYRGFYAWEIETAGSSQPPIHHSPNPRFKTVFVYDRIGNPDTAEALNLFRNASEARVFVVKPGHGLLDESRVMNRNVGDGPTKGPQHAIGLRFGAKWGPSTPATPGGEEVRVGALRNSMVSMPSTKPALVRTLYRRAIAARLLTACRVGDPGDRSRVVGFSVVPGADGGPVVRTSEGRYVVVRDEATGLDLAEQSLARAIQSGRIVANRTFTEPFDLFPGGLVVAKRGGDHSGPLDNIMRSAFAEAYEVDGSDTLYVISVPPAEKLGYDLTTTSAGDDYNSPNPMNVPRTRYGDSQKPPSRSQFDVIDRAP